MGSTVVGNGGEGTHCGVELWWFLFFLMIEVKSYCKTAAVEM